MRACGLGIPQGGLGESCEAEGGQAGCVEAPGGLAASDRAQGGGRGQRARPRLCVRSRALGVLRLCVTLAGVRAGAGGGARGGERGEGLPPPQPAPPSGLLAGRCRPLAGAEGNAGPGAQF